MSGVTNDQIGVDLERYCLQTRWLLNMLMLIANYLILLVTIIAYQLVVKVYLRSLNYTQFTVLKEHSTERIVQNHKQRETIDTQKQIEKL